MRRVLTLAFAVSLLTALVAAPLAASPAKSRFALSGEARALEVAVGDQGVTLGLAMSRADSTPTAIGVGAGQCSLLGESPDPEDLPCSDGNTEKTRYPGTPGDDNPTCSGGLPAPIDQVLKLEVACGSSKSFFKGGVPQTLNRGDVAKLSAAAPAQTLLELPVDEDKLIDDLTTALQPVLEQTPQEVRNALDGVVGVIKDLDATQLIKAEIGPSTSNITGSKGLMTVTSSAAAARIGILDMAALDAVSGLVGDPLADGLVIIEVGPSSATATLEKATADATAEASAAIVTVKIRDITKEEPTYIEQSVAPGQTVTVLEGTPAESTITAAHATTKENEGSAAAAADAVRLHLLKGVQGGIKLGLSRSTAAVNGDVVMAAPPQPKTQPKILPQTGARDLTVGGIALVLVALLLVAVRRKLA